MKLTNIRALCRAMIPGCKTDVVSDTVLDLVINEGVKDIAAFTKCLTTNKKFNAVASQGNVDNPYILSTVIGNYLVADKAGLWWNQGSVASPDYKKLNPRTIAWLDANRPNWRDLPAGTPQDYAIDNDNLIVVPAPVASLSNGFWLFHAKTPTAMTNVDAYPFSGTTVEYSHLSMFDFAIIYYVRWKVMPMLNKDYIDNYNLAQGLYNKERNEKYALLKRRPDINNSPDVAFKSVL